MKLSRRFHNSVASGCRTVKIALWSLEYIIKLVRQQDAYLAIRPAMTNKCVSRTDTNPPFAFQTAFPRGTDFTVFLRTGRVKKLHTLLVSLYF